MSEELTIFNRTAHIIKRNRAALSFPDDNAVINNVANNLVRRLRELKIDFSSVLLIGYNELVANLLRKLLHVKLIIQSDIAEQMIRKAIKDDHLKEKKSLKILSQGAAIRFLLTRVFDYLNLTEGAIVKIKDPVEYLKRLEFHDKVENYQDYFF